MNFRYCRSSVGLGLLIILLLPIPVVGQVNDTDLFINGEQVATVVPSSLPLPNPNARPAPLIRAAAEKPSVLRARWYLTAVNTAQTLARMFLPRTLLPFKSKEVGSDVIRLPIRRATALRVAAVMRRQSEEGPVAVGCNYFAEAWSDTSLVDTHTRIHRDGPLVKEEYNDGYGFVSGTVNAAVDTSDSHVTINCYMSSTTGSHSSSVQLPPVPTGETTRAAGWIWETKHNFSQTLTGAGPFAGRTVRERDPGGGVDGCWFDGSPYQPFNKITGGSWTVNQLNGWGDDQIGYGFEMVRYYRTERPKRGLPMPCGTEFRQRMQINFIGTQWRAYKVNILRAGITATTVWAERDGVKAERTWQ